MSTPDFSQDAHELTVTLQLSEAISLLRAAEYRLTHLVIRPPKWPIPAGWEPIDPLRSSLNQVTPMLRDAIRQAAPAYAKEMEL